MSRLTNIQNLIYVLFATAAALIAVAVPSISYADYIAIGPIKGEECWSFGISRCKTYELHAVKGEDGKLHTIRRRYPDVGEYRGSDGRCWFHLKSRGGGILSGVVNIFMKDKEFYTRDKDGKYRQVDVQTIMFRCRKT